MAQERDVDRNVFEPETHLMQDAVLTRHLQDELPPNFSEACTLHLRPARLITFFGHRENNEGLTEEEAENISVALSLGPKRWLGHELEFVAQPIGVMEARRQVAEGLVRCNERFRYAPQSHLSPASTACDSDEGQLVGDIPPSVDSPDEGPRLSRMGTPHLKLKRKARGCKSGESPNPGLPPMPPASEAGSHQQLGLRLPGAP